VEQVRLVRQEVTVHQVQRVQVVNKVILVLMVHQALVEEMPQLELQDQADAQEVLVLMVQAVHQAHQVVQEAMVHQDREELVALVDVMVQEEHLVRLEPLQQQVLLQAQEVQEHQLHLEAQDYLVIDIDQLLLVPLHWELVVQLLLDLV
jgi:hypothetical protein